MHGRGIWRITSGSDQKSEQQGATGRRHMESGYGLGSSLAKSHMLWAIRGFERMGARGLWKSTRLKVGTNEER